MLTRHLYAAILAVVAAMGAAFGADPAVNSADALKKALASADNGQTIEIAAGRYVLTDLKIARDATLIGRGEVVFYSSRPTAKGILNTVSGASLRIENIRFLGATSPDQNGAGIRHDGVDLTVVNCAFEDNDNGILSTGAKNGRIRIEDSEFLRNGFGDGYSHGVYVVRAASLEIVNSRFLATKFGHHVKSLADRTRITGSILDDGEGRTSYSLDASRGGEVIIADNTIIQSANGDNSTIVNYDLSRGGDAAGLSIVNNRIINRRPDGRLLRNATNLRATIADNDIINESGGELEM